MSYIATTQANDREDWREALRAAAAEIETEEVRIFLRRTTRASPLTAATLPAAEKRLLG